MNDGMGRFPNPEPKPFDKTLHFHQWPKNFHQNVLFDRLSRIRKLLEATNRTNIRNQYFPVCELKKCPAGQVGAGLECSTLPPHSKCLTKMCFDWECEIGWERDTDPTKMVCHDIDECSISGPLSNWFQIFIFWTPSVRYKPCPLLDSDKDISVTLDIGRVCVLIHREVTNVNVETIMLEMVSIVKLEDVIMEHLEKANLMIVKVRSRK